jgi:F-type H+-transporting ATPase subunit b
MEQVMPNYTIAIQAIIFLVSLLVVKQLILDPISKLLRERNSRIEKREEEARGLEQQANELDESYRQKIKDARAQAIAERNAIRQEALSREKELLKDGRERAQKILEHIRQEIGSEVESAGAVLRQQASELAVRFGEKILGRRLQ